MAEFFLELVSEEIPPAQQETAALSLERLLLDAFRKEGVAAKTRATFSTPLRFGICLDEVPTTLPARSEERRGPPESAPAKAVEGFTRTCGTAAKIEVRDGYYFALITTPETAMGERLRVLLPELLRAFPWQKSMRWIEGDDFRWVRPLREITCLLDGEALDFQVARLTAGNKKGVRDFDDYQKTMHDNNILIDPQERQDKIQKQMEKLLKESKSYDFAKEPLFETENIIKQMSRITEQPKLLKSSISMNPENPLPQLMDFISIREAQKSLFYKELCIPIGLLTKDGSSWSGVFVALIKENQERAEKNARSGIKKTLDARLEDLRFFLNEDNKIGLDRLREKLKSFPFYPKLGTMLDKANRIKTLCEKYNDEAIQQATYYCKADIATQTAQEFPEATGGIGRHLFPLENKELDQKQGSRIIRAIETHYQPIGAKDNLPSKEGQLLGLADRADTLVGFFSINELPTGSKDPFALRRAAIGMIRIILESNDNDFSQLNLNELFTQALQEYGNQNEAVLDKLRLFITERLKYHLRQDFAPDLVDAAIKDTNLNLKRIEARVKALHAFLKSDNGKALMAAWRRISGILKNNASSAKLNHDLLKEKAEINLAQQLNLPAYAQALEAHDFNQAFTILASLRQNFDTFFDEVRVETDDKTLTQNRLALCAAAQDMMRQAADFSKIQT